MLDNSEKLLYLQEAIRVLKNGGKYLTHLGFDYNLEEFDMLKFQLEQVFDNIKIRVEEVNLANNMPYGYKWEIEKQK